MFISVIIPYFKDYDGLRLCLKALSNQTLSSELFEILVINNEQEPQHIPFELPQNAKLYHEPKPGSYAARNKGILLAIGELIAFTDSDCIPDPSWLEEGLKLFSQYEHLERIGGKIDLSYQSADKTATEVYESVYAFDQKDNVRKGLSVTANLWVKKSAFSRFGLFPDTLFSGGDFQWNRIASAGNSEIRYSDQVRVTHPARTNFDQLRKKAKRVAGGQHGLPGRSLSKIKAVGYFIWELRPPVFEWRKIAKADHLNFYNKVKVWWIRYWFRAVKAREQFYIEGLGKGLTNT